MGVLHAGRQPTASRQLLVCINGLSTSGCVRPTYAIPFLSRRQLHMPPPKRHKNRLSRYRTVYRISCFVDEYARHSEQRAVDQIDV